MKQIMCDRCHKVLDDREFFTLKQRNPWINVPNKDYQLCEDCFDKFYKFIKGD